MDNDELKILIQAVIDEEESLRLMTAQMDHLLSQLNKATKDKLKVGVELDTSKAEKQAAADLGKAKIPDVEAKAEVKVEGTEDLRELAKQADKTSNSAGNMAAKLYLARTALQVLRKTAREAAQTVTELDKAATNLALATGSGSEEAYGLISQYNALAREIGATTTQVADAANEWLRQGMTAAETTELIEQSMILSKVGAMESSAATQNLTSAMKGYGLAVADVSGIVDKLTSIDLKAAVTSSDLAVAMSRTASSANIAGVSMDKLLGYIATVEETTQKGAESMDALKQHKRNLAELVADEFL